jgi:beta-glucanase (GH16 family)
MKRIYLMAGILACAPAWAEPPGNAKDWKLAFEDEFDGRTLDARKWSPNYPWGSIHNHMAYMDSAHVRVAGGKLVIRGVNERHPKATDTAKFSGRTLKVDYQAGAVHTSGKFDFTHGYAEARLKAPKGRGYCPPAVAGRRKSMSWKSSPAIPIAHTSPCTMEKTGVITAATAAGSTNCRI